MTIKQTLCPYTTSPLSESAMTNKEHILPVSLGAPDSFFVWSDAAENSRYNDLIDAPAGNDQLLRFIAMTQGVKSRSGTVSANVPGTIDETGDVVITEFSADGIKVKFRNPIERDPETGAVRVVKGYGGDAKSLADTVQANAAKKGITLELGDARSIEGAWINGRLEGDLSIIRRELVKTAYLMTVRVFGDAAISSLSGSQFRDAMMAVNEDEMRARIKGGALGKVPPLFPESGHGKHQLATVKIDDAVYTLVSLFGIFQAFFITQIEPTFDTGDIFGEQIEINVATGATSRTDGMQLLQQVLLAAASAPKNFRPK